MIFFAFFAFFAVQMCGWANDPGSNDHYMPFVFQGRARSFQIRRLYEKVIGVVCGHDENRDFCRGEWCAERSEDTCHFEGQRALHPQTAPAGLGPGPNRGIRRRRHDRQLVAGSGNGNETAGFYRRQWCIRREAPHRKLISQYREAQGLQSRISNLVPVLRKWLSSFSQISMNPLKWSSVNSSSARSPWSEIDV